MDAIASHLPDGARSWSIDWIRFGELLRAAIGWQATYPADPDSAPAPVLMDDERELGEYGMHLANLPSWIESITLEEFRSLGASVAAADSEADAE